MIILDDKWRISADPYNFILHMDGKNAQGKYMRVNATYHSTLGQALKAYHKNRLLNIADGRDISLDEAVDRALKLEKDIDELKRRLDHNVE